MIDTKALREKILDLAMRGKLVPQDPTDEPASELLKRIKTEKEQLIKEKKIRRDKNETEIFRGDDGLYYEKFQDGTVKETEVPYELPEGWEWTRISSIFYNHGQSIPESKFMYIDIAAIDNARNKVRQSNVEIIDAKSAPSRARKIVKNGDVIFSSVRPYLKNSAIIDFDATDFIASTAFVVMKPIFVSKKYLLNTLLSPFMMQEIMRKSTGSSYPAINDANFKTLFFPLPPEKEQKKIEKTLIKSLDIINEMEKEQQSLKQLSEQLKKKVLDIAMRGKLVPQDPNDEPASALLEKIREEKQRLYEEGKLKKKDLKESIIFKGDDNSYYQELPKTWQVRSLKEVSIIEMGQSPKSVNVAPDIQGIEFHQGKSFFGDKNLNESKIYTSQVTKLVERPSIVMSVRAPVGDVNLVNRQIVIGRGLTAISPVHIVLDYFYYYLSTKKPELESQATGTTFKAISGDIIRKTIIPIPPYLEQVAIVKKIASIESVLDSIK